MSESKCYSYQGVHIPGCMGCAVYGHRRGCTCGLGARAGGADANAPESYPIPTPEERERATNPFLKGEQPPRLPPFSVVRRVD